MRLLLVEDDITFAKVVVRALEKAPGCEVVWAQGRNEALAALDQGYFELVLLDRRIPSARDVLDGAADHGWAVFDAIRTRYPGTCVWFLTGYEDADFATQVLNDFSRAEDVHGIRGREPVYRVFWKKKMPECIAQVQAFAAQRAALDGIAVQFEGTRPLHAMEKQVVRLFGRRHAGAVAQVTVLSGGLSDSRVLKVILRHADQRFITSAVAKVSILPAIDDEGGRYRDDVVRLTQGGFPTLSETISVGAGDRGGLFYGMVGQTVVSLFDRIVDKHPSVPGIPSLIRAIEDPWYQGRGAEIVQVARIRRLIIPDTDLPEIAAELDGIDIAPVDAVQIQAAACCQHGDMHCANVMFDDRGQPMLIDFGDVGQSFACVDPVTLELSTVFHLQAQRLPRAWPTEALLANWADLDAYVVGCAYAEFIRACRQWALAVAASPKEIYAVGFAYGLRQLKYVDTNKAFARALIRACIAQLSN